MLKILKPAKTFSVDNSPVILTALGVAGVISTAVLTGKAVLKAERIMQEELETHYVGGRKFTTPTKREVFDLTWTCYIPPVLSGTATITCIVLANRIGNKRAAALAAAFTVTEKAYTEYTNKVVDILGEKEHQRVRDAVAQDQTGSAPVDQSKIIMIGSDDVLCFDAFSGRYFMSSMETIRKAQNDINEQLFNDELASLTDFYQALDIPRTSFSDEVGWNVGKLLEVEFGTSKSPDNKPCLTINFTVLPVKNYWRND